MLLLDHFHPPLKNYSKWHSVHHTWATFIATGLNRLLPCDFHATPHAQLGIEIDVAAFDRSFSPGAPKAVREVIESPYLGVALENETPQPDPANWHPPSPTGVIPFALLSESVEVLIYSSIAEPSLVGAIELVSPANKDRPAERQAFTAKCEAYLRQGVGLVMVDVVTQRRANLHNELLTRLGASTTPMNASLYATAYHAVKQEEEVALEIWQESLVLGQPLPTLPLWLRREVCAPLDLNASYAETCAALRIDEQLLQSFAIR